MYQLACILPGVEGNLLKLIACRKLDWQANKKVPHERRDVL